MADVKISELTALTTPDGAEELVVNDNGVTKKIRTDDLFAGDNVKAKFGASDDLQIYHDGSHSYIDDTGSGNLFLRASTQIRFRSPTNEDMLVLNENGSAKLYFDNAGKLETTATGVDVTGTVTADGLTVQGNAAIGLNQDISMSAGADGQLQIDGNGYNAAIALDTVGMNIYTNSATRGIIFGTNETERARIDSSGNLLVGKTTPTITTAGHDFYSSGVAYHTASAIEPLQLNRLSSDGSIVTFRKDNITVGSIGVSSDNLYTVATDVGLFFNSGSAQILPCGAGGGLVDGQKDLGRTSARFKDLYLSGGVYLGGTGAANKLDDYEEGTWTPVLSGAYGLSVGASPVYSGTYVKIGRMVYCTMIIDADTTETIATNDRIGFTGLPFTPDEETLTGAGNAWVYKSVGSGVNAFGTVGMTNTSVWVNINTVYSAFSWGHLLRAKFMYETNS